jgi:hypothetical protein
MTVKEIEKAIGYSFARGQATYDNVVRFKTADGSTIGIVRHSSERYDGSTKLAITLAEDDGGAYWHYHETDGKPHGSKRIYSAEIAEVLS